MNHLLILENWAKNSNLKITILSSSLDLKPRILRIAWARNRILDFVHSTELASFDYLIMIDLDEVNANISIPALLDCFHLKSNWDVLTANQLGYYYDLFALRTEKYDLNPCGPGERATWNNGTDIDRLFNIDSGNSKELAPDLGLIPVLSAFGGLGIYKMHLFEGLRYEPSTVYEKSGKHFLHPETGIKEYDCEHVDIHTKMRDKYNAKIYINTALINND
jgi:hypothetical protein